MCNYCNTAKSESVSVNVDAYRGHWVDERFGKIYLDFCQPIEAPRAKYFGKQVKLIYDIGMYDASDTKYYLSEGYNVLAVEANPFLVKRAARELEKELSQGRVEFVNAAISDRSGEEITLTVCGDDIGASTIYGENIASRNPIGAYSVLTVTLGDLIESHGLPFYLKVDIEGADRFCVLELTSNNRPTYLSFEVGQDLEELMSHCVSIGFAKFKLVNQCNFRELSKQKKWQIVFG